MTTKDLGKLFSCDEALREKEIASIMTADQQHDWWLKKFYDDLDTLVEQHIAKGCPRTAVSSVLRRKSYEVAYQLTDPRGGAR